MNQHKNEKGFTLIEMMVVITLIAIVGGVVVVNLMGQLGAGQAKAAQAQMKSYAQVLDMFALDCNGYPSTDMGLDALRAKPSGLDCPAYPGGGYLKDEANFKDPFGQAYQYTSDGASYEIRSLGQDRKPSEDDVTVKGGF